MLTPKQAAGQVGVSVSLVYQWCREGLVEHLRLGASGKRGRVMIDPISYERFLESRRLPSKHPLALKHINLSP